MDCASGIPLTRGQEHFLCVSLLRGRENELGRVGGGGGKVGSDGDGDGDDDDDDDDDDNDDNDDNDASKQNCPIF